MMQAARSKKPTEGDQGSGLENKNVNDLSVPGCVGCERRETTK